MSILEDYKNGERFCVDCRHSRDNSNSLCNNGPCNSDKGNEAFEPVEKKEENRCINCGIRINSGKKFCRECNDKASKSINFLIEYLPEVKKIITNRDCTILLFKDGGKSVVKKGEGEKYDLEKAVLYAYVKWSKKPMAINAGFPKGGISSLIKANDRLLGYNEVVAQIPTFGSRKECKK